MYEFGEGVARDHRQALQWIRKATLERPGSAIWIGQKYADHVRTPQDRLTAMEWYRISAEAGNDTAQTELGFLYESSGEFAQATRWFRRAARTSAPAMAEIIASTATAIPTCRNFPMADLMACIPDTSITSLALAPFSWFPYILLGYYTLLFVAARKIRVVYICGLIGLIGALNEGILKNLIKQPRPELTCACGYGMPSGHSAIAAGFFVWVFLDTFVTYFIKVTLVNGNGVGSLHFSFKNLNSITKIFNFATIVPLLLYIPTIISRVHLNYHTWQQVTVGSIVGALIGVAYFVFTFVFGRAVFEPIFRMRLFRWLRVDMGPANTKPVIRPNVLPL